jgi:hypothetical protein
MNFEFRLILNFVVEGLHYDQILLKLLRLGGNFGVNVCVCE